MTSALPEEGHSAGQWYVVDGSRETGPFTQDELVQKAQSGELQADHQIRKSGSVVPVAARRLAFLKFAARPTTTASSSESTDSTQSSARAAQTAIDRAISGEFKSKHKAARGAWYQQSLGPRGQKLLFGFCGLLAAVMLGGWWMWTPVRHPAPPGHLTKYGPIVIRKPVARPKSPAITTLPKVPKGRRVSLPGFENIEPAYTPTLSSDLKTVVYAGGHPQNGYDLFISKRNDVNEPFEKPKHIPSCGSPETDAYPALSPDGLDLIFVRSDKEPRMYHSTRRTVSEPFGPPELIVMGTFDSEHTNVYLPQLPTELDVIFLVRAEGPAGWEIMQASRKSRDEDFQTPRPIPFADPSPPYRLTNDMLRAYFGWPKGIWMSARGSLKDLFDPSHAEINPTVCGEIEGPIFVSPLEDVFIFSGPEPGKKLGESRKLWVVQP